MATTTLEPERFDFVVEPTQGWSPPNLALLWEYRELVLFLAWRDVIVRYKQSLLGIGWAVFQPVMTMLIFTVVFGRFARLPSEGVPYAVFTYSALLPWMFFSTAVTRSASSLVANSSLLTKIYFPRLVLPIASTLAMLVDFAISLAVFFVLLVVFGIWPGWQLVFLPLFIVLAVAASLAIGIWLAALNVRYRDVGYVVPFLVQLTLFLSPVAYSAQLIPAGPWRIAYALNPLAGVIQGFRWSTIHGQPPDFMLVVSVVLVLVLLITGVYYFRRTEKSFADVI
ncbi:MAG TPA: ABC transporter permease [Candidatus Dormibacteraeota bacterium]